MSGLVYLGILLGNELVVFIFELSNSFIVFDLTSLEFFLLRVPEVFALVGITILQHNDLLIKFLYLGSSLLALLLAFF